MQTPTSLQYIVFNAPLAFAFGVINNFQLSFSPQFSISRRPCSSPHNLSHSQQSTTTLALTNSPSHTDLAPSSHDLTHSQKSMATLALTDSPSHADLAPSPHAQTQAWSAGSPQTWASRSCHGSNQCPTKISQSCFEFELRVCNNVKELQGHMWWRRHPTGAVGENKQELEALRHESLPCGRDLGGAQLQAVATEHL
jgi:hypothetical protein